MGKLDLSVQLYSLRDLTAADFAGTVKQVAQIGYRGVELAGYGNLASAAEARQAVDAAGLKVSGMHVGIEALEKNQNQVFDDANTLGTKHVIVPWMHPDRRKDAAGWKAVAAALDHFGAAAVQRGLVLSYHNHDFEFERFNGQSGFDILWANSNPQFVKAELDVFWLQYAGIDPVTCIRKLGKRVSLLHLKDMEAGPQRRFSPVGSGILDFKAILAAGRELDLEWGVVEQDDCYGAPPMQVIRTSFENLRKLGL